MSPHCRNNQVLVFGHGGHGNRGCEAIIRGTSSLLKTELPGCRVVVASLTPEADAARGLEDVDEYLAEGRACMRRFSARWMKRAVLNHVLRDPVAAEAMNYPHVVEASARSGLALSVGGDNYCYGSPHWLYAIDREVKKKNTPLVLWGASVEPAAIDEGMRGDLAKFDLIIARESLTYEALLDRKVNDRIYLHPDPAFTMKKEDLPLPVGWLEGGMLGVNISPMVMRYEARDGIAVRATIKLIEYVLAHTPLSVALIPHVTWPQSNDCEPLSRIHAEFQHSERVILVPGDLTAPQYKGFIARCSLFIGARTHATIAAYSSGVPTLVVGYSIKARGIARDLFGDESLVIPVQGLDDEWRLVRGFEMLRERGGELRSRLLSVIPEVKDRAVRAVRRLQVVID